MKLLSCVLVVLECQSLEDSESLSMDEVEPEMDGSRVFKTTGGAKSRKGDRRTPNLLVALQNPNTLGGQ